MIDKQNYKSIDFSFNPNRFENPFNNIIEMCMTDNYDDAIREDSFAFRIFILTQIEFKLSTRKLVDELILDDSFEEGKGTIINLFGAFYEKFFGINNKARNIGKYSSLIKVFFDEYE